MASLTERKAGLTTGKIGPAILAFILPMMLGSLIQQLYTMTDSVIMGQFAGKVAWPPSTPGCGPWCSTT